MHKLINFFLARLNNILLAIFFTLCSLIIMILFGFLYNLYNINALSGALKNKDCIYFTLDFEGYIDFNFLCNNTNIVLMKCPKTSGILDYEVIYSNIENNLSTGRNFDTNDFYKSNNKVAIVGNKVDQIIDIDNLTIENQKYNIIGVLKEDEWISNYNFAIYYLKENINQINSSGVFVLDGDSKRNINNTFETIFEELSSRNIKVQKMNMNKVSLLDYIKYEKTLLTVYIFSFTIFICAFIIILMIWLNSNLKYIAINKMIGKKYIWINILSKYFICYIIGAIGGYLIPRIFITDNRLLLDFKIYFSIIIIYFFISLIIFLFLKNNYNKCEIRDILENDYE